MSIFNSIHKINSNTLLVTECSVNIETFMQPYSLANKINSEIKACNKFVQFLLLSSGGPRLVL